MTSKPQSGLKPAVPKRQTFVQTERAAHVEWGRLVMSKPAAAAVMHQLIALMDKTNAVAISHSTLAELIGVHQTTVKKALKYLREHHWVQVVQLGPRGTVNAYVVNDRVAWADYRDNKRLSIFSARIVASAAEQDEATLSTTALRKVPIIHPPEQALPSGEWPQGSQPTFDGMEPVAEGWPEDQQQTDLEDFTGRQIEGGKS